MTSQIFIRNMNERRVLTLLRREGRLSRADIARRLGLTRSGVSYIVEGLIDLDLVAEAPVDTGAHSARDLGRPGVALRIHPGGHFFLGVEIGVRLVRLALVDMALEPALTRTIELPRSPTPAEALDLIAAFLAECEATAAFAGRIRAISATVPGLVRGDGFVVHLPILGWRNVNFLALARARFALPVSLENNANAAAFGEVYRNTKTSSDLVLFLKLGNGCGGAAIIQGRLLRGTSGVATEFGHMRVSEGGPTCSCGRIGCLETHVNLAALARYLGEAGSDLSCDPVRVAAAMEAGDRAVLAAVERLEAYLVAGMINLGALFNPSDIVLGGAMRPMLAQGLDRLHAGLVAGLPEGVAPPVLILSQGGDLECAIGAAAITHHAQFDTSGLTLVEGAPPGAVPSEMA